MSRSGIYIKDVGGESRVVIHADQFTMNDDVVKEWIKIMKEQSKKDTLQIEVGSEWVATLSKQGEKTLVVLHVGQQMSLCKWVADNREFSIKNTEFNTAYKPKPKTVTMYFHKTKTGEYYAQETKCTGYLFTKEIEL